MKRINVKSASYVVLTIALLAAGACGKKVTKTEKKAEMSTPVGNVGATDSSTPASTPEPTAEPETALVAPEPEAVPAPKPLENPLCERPFSVVVPDMKPIIQMKDLPKGKFELESVEMYVVDGANKNSYLISATGADDFEVHVTCNGIIPPQAPNAAPAAAAATVTGSATASAEGGTVTATITLPQEAAPAQQYAGAPSTYESSFVLGTNLDTRSQLYPDLRRQISVTFENGALVSKDSRVIDDPMKGKRRKDDKTVPLVPIEVSPGTFMTVRTYLMNPTTIELRTKIEFASDVEGGARRVQYSRAVFMR